MVAIQNVCCGAGWAAAPYFDFLKGVNNELARTHLQGVQPRTDTNQGPKGRLADMVRHVTLWLPCRTDHRLTVSCIARLIGRDCKLLIADEAALVLP